MRAPEPIVPDGRRPVTAAVRGCPRGGGTGRTGATDRRHGPAPREHGGLLPALPHCPGYASRSLYAHLVHAPVVRLCHRTGG